MRRMWDKEYLKEELFRLFEDWYHKEVETFDSRGMMGSSGRLYNCNTMELLNEIMWKIEMGKK